MSLFLGKIHYWLYNKIVNYEVIEKDLINWSRERELNIEELINKLQKEYGAPLDNRPLEEIIDTSNIHGWLQNKISNAEIRQAALVTKILEINDNYMNDIVEIYKGQGIKAAQVYANNKLDRPQDIYQILNDVILEGMPCDRVSDVIENNGNELIWNTTVCLHKPYWDKVGGDVKNFYKLREVWIKNFIKTLNPHFNYERLSEDSQKISKL